VIETRRDARLALESHRRVLSLGDLRVQELDRDGTLETELCRAPHDAGGALSKHLVQSVLARDRVATRHDGGAYAIGYALGTVPPYPLRIYQVMSSGRADI